MQAIELLNVECKTPARLIKRASDFCNYYRGSRTKLINELSKFDCPYARYWIQAINEIG